MYSESATAAHPARVRVVALTSGLLRGRLQRSRLEATTERKGGPGDKGGEGGALVRHGANPSRRHGQRGEAASAAPSAARAFHVKRLSPVRPLPRGAQKPSPTAAGRGQHRALGTRCLGAHPEPPSLEANPARRPSGGPTRAPRVPPPAPPAGRGPSRASARSEAWLAAGAHSGTAADPAQRSGPPGSATCSPARASITVERPAGTRHAPPCTVTMAGDHREPKRRATPTIRSTEIMAFDAHSRVILEGVRRWHTSLTGPPERTHLERLRAWTWPSFRALPLAGSHELWHRPRPRARSGALAPRRARRRLPRSPWSDPPRYTALPVHRRSWPEISFVPDSRGTSRRCANPRSHPAPP